MNRTRTLAAVVAATLMVTTTLTAGAAHALDADDAEYLRTLLPNSEVPAPTDPMPTALQLSATITRTTTSAGVLTPENVNAISDLNGKKMRVSGYQWQGTQEGDASARLTTVNTGNAKRYVRVTLKSRAGDPLSSHFTRGKIGYLIIARESTVVALRTNGKTLAEVAIHGKRKAGIRAAGRTINTLWANRTALMRDSRDYLAKNAAALFGWEIIARPRYNGETAVTDQDIMRMATRQPSWLLPTREHIRTTYAGNGCIDIVNITTSEPPVALTIEMATGRASAFTTRGCP